MRTGPNKQEKTLFETPFEQYASAVNFFGSVKSDISHCLRSHIALGNYMCSVCHSEEARRHDVEISWKRTGVAHLIFSYRLK